MSDTADPSHGGRPGSLADLRGLRLGRCARRILLLAPSTSQDPAIVPPDRPDRASADSHRRAMRSLAAHGLVELTWSTETVETRQVRTSPRVRWDASAGVYQDGDPSPTRVERDVKRRAIRLTLLGESVVDRFRRALENGQRIRWDSVDEKHTC
jgi:hypothetical protein